MVRKLIDPTALLAEDERLTPEVASRLASQIEALQGDRRGRPAAGGEERAEGAGDGGSLVGLLDTQRSLMDELDPLRMMRRLLHQVLELVPAADGAAIELATPGGELLCACGVGSLAPATGEVHPSDVSPAGLALRRGVPVYEGDAGPRAGSAAYVPLSRSRERIGVLVGRAPVSGAFSPADIDAMASLANFVGVAVANALDLATAVEQLLADERRRRLGLSGPGQAGVDLTGGDVDLDGGRPYEFASFVAGALGHDLAEQRRLAAVADRVREVLDEDAVEVTFQPIVDLRERAVVGYEALARFPTHPPRSADAWFADAAAVGLQRELELAALGAALAHVERLPDSTYLAVNMSPGTACLPDLTDAIAGTPGDRLVIELTEHAPVEDYVVLREALDRLRARGIRLAIDDAGAGFASLRHILRLAPDLIKLDNALTHNIDTDPVRQALASALIAFAAEVDTRIVAEGIENHWELDALRGLGVSYGQGFHLGRPGDLE